MAAGPSGQRLASSAQRRRSGGPAAAISLAEGLCLAQRRGFGVAVDPEYLFARPTVRAKKRRSATKIAFFAHEKRRKKRR